MSDFNKIFPFATALDVSPLVDFWREAAQDSTNSWNGTAKDVLERVEGIPELTGPVDDPGLLEAHQAGLKLLMSAFTSPLNEGIMAAAMVPWQMTPVYMTTTAEQADLVVHMGEHFQKTFSPEEMFVAGLRSAPGPACRP